LVLKRSVDIENIIRKIPSDNRLTHVTLFFTLSEQLHLSGLLQYSMVAAYYNEQLRYILKFDMANNYGSSG
jgi:hypothetical protein